MKRRVDLEKNLLDINNAEIPKLVMDTFWKLKEEHGTLPMGISRTNDMYFIVSPSYENYIMWYTNIKAF